MRVSSNNGFKFIIPRDKNSLIRGHPINIGSERNPALSRFQKVETNGPK